jgi:uncharacterized membrane protein
MASAAHRDLAFVPSSLPAWRVRSISFQVVLISTAVILPHVAHVAGAPIFWLLPMHWPVILAALVYGPAAGLVVGVLSPTVSFMTSGMPPMPSLAVMTVELGLYGLLTGLLRTRLRWNAILAVAVALLAGRIVAMVIGLALGRPFVSLASVYAQGLLCGVLQLVTLPILARWWIAHESAARGGNDA